jgi:predicted RNA-binding protein
MAKYWIITTSPENFEVDRQNNFAVEGFRDRNRRTIEQVKVGDKFAIYIRQLQRIGAIVTATSGFYYDDTDRIWTEADEIWPCRFKTQPELVLAEDELLDVKKLVRSLSFVTAKQKATKWGLAFQGSLRRIPEEDFNLIESEMRKIKATIGEAMVTVTVEPLEIGLEPATIEFFPSTEEEAKQAIMRLHLERTSLHDRIGEMLETIGSRMGYNAFTRHKITPEHALELDVAWLEGKNPEVAIEVQIGGEIIAAKERLAQAKKFNYRKVIVVIEEDQKQRLNDILRFDELRHWLDAWSIQAVYKLYTSGISFFDLYHQLADSRYKDRPEINLVYP